MLQPVFDFIEKFATDFTWKRLVILISILILVGVVFFFYEAITAANQLSKYERSVSIMEKLETLKLDNEGSKAVAKNIYFGLTSITNPSSNHTSFKTNLSKEIKQALLAASPWVLLCLFSIPGYFKGKKDTISTIIGSLVVGLVMGIGGYSIPIEWDTWVGLGVYPFGLNFLIFYGLMWYGKRHQ